MKVISSKLIFYYKTIFPLFWFGILGVVLVSTIVSGVASKEPIALAMPMGMAIFGYYIMKKLVFDLVDEVIDGGSFLLIRNKGWEDRIDLSNIMNVSATQYINPSQVVLHLLKPSRFGSQITFMPQFKFGLFPKSEIAEDLMLRVYQTHLNSQK
jgi:hypothetical protein